MDVSDLEQRHAAEFRVSGVAAAEQIAENVVRFDARAGF
jgi:hypothetical protein